jgi:hypothetical protein
MLSEKQLVAVQLRRLHARLRHLRDLTATTRFYWTNGVIRERWLHPTKGVRDRRFEAFPLTVKGASLEGYLTFADVADLVAGRTRLASDLSGGIHG